MVDSKARQADEPTPEMIDAGASALADWFVDEDHEPGWEVAARLCYRAMITAFDAQSTKEAGNVSV